MGPPSAGGVVLVPYPFSDLSQAKVRPAVCLADAGRGDWVLCQVTSSPYGDPLDAPDFATGGLLVRSVGALTPAAFARVLAAVVAVLRPAASPKPPAPPTGSP